MVFLSNVSVDARSILSLRTGHCQRRGHWWHNVAGGESVDKVWFLRHCKYIYLYRPVHSSVSYLQHSLITWAAFPTKNRSFKSANAYKDIYETDKLFVPVSNLALQSITCSTKMTTHDPPISRGSTTRLVWWPLVAPSTLLNLRACRPGWGSDRLGKVWKAGQLCLVRIWICYFRKSVSVGHRSPPQKK